MKPDLARPKFLISVSSVRINCEKIMPSKYSSVIVHLYLKIATTEIKSFTNMALKAAR
jgi:hypothetical protein